MEWLKYVLLGLNLLISIRILFWIKATYGNVDSAKNELKKQIEDNKNNK